MVMHGASNQLKCRLLPLTFKDSAQDWFNTQQPGSITNFTDLLCIFLSQFSACKIEKVTLETLIGIRREENKTLRQYVARLEDIFHPLEKEASELCVAEFKSGLRSGPFNNDLTRRLAKTFQDVKGRAKGFMLEEEDDLSKKARDTYIAS
jgi:hypothetical protein